MTAGDSLLSRLRGRSVLIIGDVMIDHFVIGRVDRISPEAPVPVVRFDNETFRLGGAANVAHNVAALGGEAQLIGLTGADAEAGRVRESLSQLQIGAGGLVEDASRCTTRKLRVVTARNQQVARVDYESDAEITGDVEQRVVSTVQQYAGEAAAIVISDYLKGCITARVMHAAVEVGRARQIPVLVDPKIPHIDYYSGAAVITPNHHEAEIAANMRVRTDDDARAAARVLRERAACDAVLMTRGDQGMWLLGDGLEGSLPAAAREVSDVTGAGDTVIALLAAAFAAGATLVEAARLANQAAGISVAKFGPAVVTPAELLRSIDESAAV
jgi:D-beta-D-heptose 7-phosphate kinase/D-beta-D-heptose 1-phosphate adenosyltransferase